MPAHHSLLAHSSPGGGPGEPLDQHLAAVAKLAEGFAARFGAGEWGSAAGLLHDAGKLRAAFQAYIRGEGPAAQHSICGAVRALEHYPPAVGHLLAYVIAGHHAGLPDGGNAGDGCLDARLATGRALLADMAPWSQALTLPTIGALPVRPARAEMGFAVSFFVRMLFSALADADFLATENFYRPHQAAERQAVAAIPLTGLLERLDRHIAGLEAVGDPTILARRAEVLRRCVEMVERPPGTFTLSVPTGGGKTLSSLSFALRHAIRWGLRRVIYVIPYTSIIEQTADVFRQAFGDLAEAVVEHHSAARPPEDEQVMGPDRLRLATENWDAPVIVTTSVQFFESLYADRPSRCRKLHNIGESVVVVDEVQALPRPVLAPCMRALRELASVPYRASVVLCSATLPDLARRPAFRAGLDQPTEIVADVAGLFAAFRRVRTERAGRLDDAALAGRLADEPQVLCVVDNRARAVAVRDLLSQSHPDGTYHLSAAMCPAHRREVVATVKERLKGGLPCRLVATTVVEAGIDFSFPTVWRAAAGLDSLAQAAGRCNRHGEWPGGRFVVFYTPGRPFPPELETRRALAAPLLERFADPLGLEAMEAYFTTLLTVDGDQLDEPRALRRLAEGAAMLDFPFRSLARDFRLIDEPTTPVVVPWRGLAEPLLAELEGGRATLATFRSLQQLTVALYPSQLEALRAAGALRQAGPEGAVTVLWRAEFYDDAVGMGGMEG